MPIKVLILDFDGTFADTKKLYYNSIHKWLAKEGIKFSDKEFRKYFGLKLGEILKKLKIKKDVKDVKIKVIRDIIKTTKTIRLSPYIGYFRKLKIRRIILSNTKTSIIKMVLKRKKIDYFSEIYGGDKFSSKEKFISSYLRKHKLKKSEAAYIGDMAKDIEIARKAGVISVAISHKYSWDSYSRLKHAGSDFLISSFYELKKILSYA